MIERLKCDFNIFMNMNKQDLIDGFIHTLLLVIILNMLVRFLFNKIYKDEEEIN